MNRLTPTPQKRPLATLSISIVLLSLIAFSSCKKDNNTTGRSENVSLTGSWKFTLSPDKSIPDTTLIKGIRGSDEPEYAADFEDVFLYENKSGHITGDYNNSFRFEGTRKKDSVIIKVFNRKNGFVDPVDNTKEMNHISTMRLKIDSSGYLTGKGSYEVNPDYVGAEKETYFVTAKKRSDITTPFPGQKELKSSLSHELCNIESSISSFFISYMSDNTFRPMGNCYLEKDGGGYYIFGHRGPGSILPIYTQTVYFPLEWSWCKVRKYHFAIELQGKIRAIEILKWIIKNKPPTKDFYAKIGFATLEELNMAIDDFYNKFGGFAISLGYDKMTHNLSFYLNTEKGSRGDIISHPLTRNIATSMVPHVHNIYYFTGKNIYDEWHLRRSDFTVCNTPLLFVYVLGTNQVYYN